MPAVKPAVAAVPTGVEALASPVLRGFKPLSFLLTLLGIPVDHLVDGTQKCVAQLGPDALQAVSALKKLLVMWAPSTHFPREPPRHLPSTSVPT